MERLDRRDLQQFPVRAVFFSTLINHLEKIDYKEAIKLTDDAELLMIIATNISIRNCRSILRQHATKRLMKLCVSECKVRQP